MPKLKPHKGLAKRVKISGKGKLIRHKSNKSHLMSSKNSRRRRRLGREAEVDVTYRKTIKRLMALA